MGDLSTYSLIDFIPFTEVVYHRLFVRLNQALWPWQALAVAGAVVLVWAAWGRRSRIAGWLLGLGWLGSGWFFHLQYYAELNWAATYAGWACIVQAVLVVATGHLDGLGSDRSAKGSSDQWHLAGVAIAAVGMFVYPLISPWVERSWAGIEVFGLMPNPTVLAAMGLLLVPDRTPWHLAVVPVLWCLITGATAYAIGTVGGLVTAGLGAAAFGLALWRTVSRCVWSAKAE